MPTSLPTIPPSPAPSPVPTLVPSLVPTLFPTPLPSPVPSSAPTPAPSSRPSSAPTPLPTAGDLTSVTISLELRNSSGSDAEAEVVIPALDQSLNLSVAPGTYHNFFVVYAPAPSKPTDPSNAAAARASSERVFLAASEAGSEKTIEAPAHVLATHRRLASAQEARASVDLRLSLSNSGLGTAAEAEALVNLALASAIADGSLAAALRSGCGCGLFSHSASAVLKRDYPTLHPTPIPTISLLPSLAPSAAPTQPPSPAPTLPPTPVPTRVPSHAPTSTFGPTAVPSLSPTKERAVLVVGDEMSGALFAVGLGALAAALVACVVIPNRRLVATRVLSACDPSWASRPFGPKALKGGGAAAAAAALEALTKRPVLVVRVTAVVPKLDLDMVVDFGAAETDQAAQVWLEQLEGRLQAGFRLGLGQPVDQRLDGPMAPPGSGGVHSGSNSGTAGGHLTKPALRFVRGEASASRSEVLAALPLASSFDMVAVGTSKAIRFKAECAEALSRAGSNLAELCGTRRPVLLTLPLPPLSLYWRVDPSACPGEVAVPAKVFPLVFELELLDLPPAGYALLEDSILSDLQRVFKAATLDSFQAGSLGGRSEDEGLLDVEAPDTPARPGERKGSLAPHVAASIFPDRPQRASVVVTKYEAIETLRWGSPAFKKGRKGRLSSIDEVDPEAGKAAEAKRSDEPSATHDESFQFDERSPRKSSRAPRTLVGDSDGGTLNSQPAEGSPGASVGTGPEAAQKAATGKVRQADSVKEVAPVPVPKKKSAPRQARQARQAQGPEVGTRLEGFAYFASEAEANARARDAAAGLAKELTRCGRVRFVRPGPTLVPWRPRVELDVLTTLCLTPPVSPRALALGALPFQLLNAHSRRKLFAERLPDATPRHGGSAGPSGGAAVGNHGFGAGPETRTFRDMAWLLERPLGTSSDCFWVVNKESRRRLVAAVVPPPDSESGDAGWSAGLGATGGEARDGPPRDTGGVGVNGGGAGSSGEMYLPESWAWWRLLPSGDGTFLIESIGSGRRLFAAGFHNAHELGSWERGVGARPPIGSTHETGEADPPRPDERWFLRPIDHAAAAEAAATLAASAVGIDDLSGGGGATTLRLGSRVEVRDGDAAWEPGTVEGFDKEDGKPLVRKDGMESAYTWDACRPLYQDPVADPEDDSKRSANSRRRPASRSPHRRRLFARLRGG